MRNSFYRWEIANKLKTRKSRVEIEDIINIFMKSRGLKTETQKKEFFDPKNPKDLELRELKMNSNSVKKSLERIKKAINKDEEIIIYGDYDADGICASAILWECLYSLTKKVKPYIPDRFEEGYGLNVDSVSKLKSQNSNLKLIITVDNGIVAFKAVKKAGDLGIDVIITDHHQKEEVLPSAYSIIHTDKISGSGIAWILAREIKKYFKQQDLNLESNGLDLAAIGTIADQLPLIGPNRSFAKYGLEFLNNTERPGLLALFGEAGIINKNLAVQSGSIGTYDINFVIAPRINAMGRMDKAIDSLRLLCTGSKNKAQELAYLLGKTNKMRQKIVDEVVLHAKKQVMKNNYRKVIVLAHESYHEGIIGLAAAKLVEEYYRPAIVFSKGKKVSKASARSVSGFNIIESIRKLDSLTLGGGGHPMAAGFSIETENIEMFKKKFDKLTAPLLTDEILTRRHKIDLEIEFENLNQKLAERLLDFEPTGVGNPTPVFMTRKAEIVDVKTVGSGGKHLKLKLEKDGKIFSAIAFGLGELYGQLSLGQKVDIAYNLSLNFWNGNSGLQLKIKDLKLIS